MSLVVFPSGGGSAQTHSMRPLERLGTYPQKGVLSSAASYAIYRLCTECIDTFMLAVFGEALMLNRKLVSLVVYLSPTVPRRGFASHMYKDKDVVLLTD